MVDIMQEPMRIEDAQKSEAVQIKEHKRIPHAYLARANYYNYSNEKRVEFPSECGTGDQKWQFVLDAMGEDRDTYLETDEELAALEYHVKVNEGAGHCYFDEILRQIMQAKAHKQALKERFGQALLPEPGHIEVERRTHDNFQRHDDGTQEERDELFALSVLLKKLPSGDRPGQLQNNYF